MKLTRLEDRVAEVNRLLERERVIEIDLATVAQLVSFPGSHSCREA